MATAAATLSISPRAASVADYLALLKPRVMSLVIFTALAGIVIARLVRDRGYVRHHFGPIGQQRVVAIPDCTYPSRPIRQVLLFFRAQNIWTSSRTRGN